MTKEASDKMLMKVASLEKAPRLLATVLAMHKQASAEKRKAEVQTKLASIMDGVLNKTAAPVPAVADATNAAKTELKDLGAPNAAQSASNYVNNVVNAIGTPPKQQGFLRNLASILTGENTAKGRAAGNAMMNFEAYKNYLLNKRQKEQASKPYYR